MSTTLSVCLFSPTHEFTQTLKEVLGDQHYNLHPFDSAQTLLGYLQNHTDQVDCLILQESEALEHVLTHLRNDGRLLPAVIVSTTDPNYCSVYHSAQVTLSPDMLSDLPSAIELALADFLKLTPEVKSSIQQINEFLTVKQRRLTEKLQERLGYQSVYYKRNPKDFFRHLPTQQKQNLLEELKNQYRIILLDYFKQESDVNAKIDQFVTKAFFADLSVSQIMEIHMDLMEQFSQQLKLEGRSDEILLDYRLTLIDIVAHLCEMYRRSVPVNAFQSSQ